MATVTVKWWRGTTQLEGKARTYRGAMRLAAWPARFYDEAGRRLHDDGVGLAYEDEDAVDGNGIAIRTYAV